MAKIKLTKGELKRQRDSLSQYLRYLPTLLLKKQQLQIEILHQLALLEQKTKEEQDKKLSYESWAGLLKADSGININQWLKPKKIVTSRKNIAGVDLEVFVNVDFDRLEYDLFIYPLWVDAAIEHLRAIVSLRQELEIIKKEIEVLRHELRITTQRVNLFENVKIPQSQEAIRVIKIYLGDQMANAVGRSKIAKRKISEATTYEAIAA
ncbi:MAG: V-type ATP synthase subunit D [Candidatus Omnitrophota bacterium]